MGLQLIPAVTGHKVGLTLDTSLVCCRESQRDGKPFVDSHRQLILNQQFHIPNEPNTYSFGLWEEARAQRENVLCGVSIGCFHFSNLKPKTKKMQIQKKETHTKFNGTKISLSSHTSLQNSHYSTSCFPVVIICMNVDIFTARTASNIEIVIHVNVPPVVTLVQASQYKSAFVGGLA